MQDRLLLNAQTFAAKANALYLLTCRDVDEATRSSEHDMLSLQRKLFDARCGFYYKGRQSEYVDPYSIAVEALLGMKSMLEDKAVQLETSNLPAKWRKDKVGELNDMADQFQHVIAPIKDLAEREQKRPEYWQEHMIRIMLP